MSIGIRYRQYQHMRAMACLSVVSQPMLAYFYNNLPMSPTLKVFWYALMVLVKFSAPVFIFYIGITVFTTKESYEERLSYVCGAYIIPFLLWGVVYLLLKLGGDYSVTQYLKMYFLGDLAPHLWYTIMMLQFQFLYPLLLKLVKPMLSSPTSALLNGFGLMTLYFFVSGGIFRIFTSNTSDWARLFDRYFITFFIYFALGIIFDVYHREIMPILAHIFPFTLIGFSGIWVLASLNNQSLVNQQYFHPLMYLYNIMAITLLLSVCFITARRISMLGNFLDYIATMAFEVYLANFFVFTLLRTLFASSLDALHPVAVLLLFYPATLLGTVLLVRGYRGLWKRFRVAPEEAEPINTDLGTD